MDRPKRVERNGGGMSVNRKFLRDSIDAKAGRQWMLALGLAITPWFSAVSWAENFNLESVDFASTGNQTHITLHTGSIVPVQKVLSSDSKLILEVDQINAGDTIRTNFAGARNISHVIMQPIGEHKIRMIIRGENLAPPTVAFFNQNTGASASTNSAFNSEALHRETQAALRQIQDSGIQAANHNPEQDSPFEGKPAPKAEAKPASAKPDLSNIAALPAQAPDTESIAFGGITGQTPSVVPPEADALKPAPTGLPEKMKPLNMPALEMPGGSNELLDKAKSGQYNNYMLGALLALLALGIGGFVINKIIRLKQVEPDLEALLLEQHNGKKVSFREMASAYRSRHDQEIRPEAGLKPAGKKNAEDVIGLRSLNQIENEMAEEIAPAPKAMASKPATGKGKAAPQAAPEAPGEPFGGKTPSMEQLISMVQAVSEAKREPQQPIKTPAPRQAVNQYMQSEKNGVNAQGQKKTGFPDETMVREVQRAQALQQELLQQAQQQIASAQANKAQPKAAPVNRASAAQKAVKPANFKSAPATNPASAKRPVNNANAAKSANNAPAINASKPAHNAPAMNASAMGKNGPLPGNPEVLNFLRNVADLMEKDGKPQIASSIHKNLSPGR